jgi:hypothetical protein
MTQSMLDTMTTTAPNWDRIKVDYEAGILPIRGIARREGISDTSIHKKAKSSGWDASLRKPAAPANPILPGLQTPAQTSRTPSDTNNDRERTEGDHTPDVYQPPYVRYPNQDPAFDWDPVTNKNVLAPNRPAFAAYLNPWMQIVIRAEASPNDYEDPFIRIDPHDVPALIERLQELRDIAQVELNTRRNVGEG